MAEKVTRLASEPIAYHLYKRGDLRNKMDKLAKSNIAIASAVFSLEQQARKERQFRV